MQSDRLPQAQMVRAAAAERGGDTSALAMSRDVSSCNTYNYDDALYWDARYVQEGESFDWYQRYSALRPLITKYLPRPSRLLMAGCGNAGNPDPRFPSLFFFTFLCSACFPQFNSIFCGLNLGFFFWFWFFYSYLMSLVGVEVLRNEGREKERDFVL